MYPQLQEQKDPGSEWLSIVTGQLTANDAGNGSFVIGQQGPSVAGVELFTITRNTTL